MVSFSTVTFWKATLNDTITHIFPLIQMAQRRPKGCANYKAMLPYLELRLIMYHELGCGT